VCGRPCSEWVNS